MKSIRLATVVLCFLFFPFASAYGQGFEVLTPETKPGGLVAIKIAGSFMSDETGLLIFHNVYRPNKEGLIFIGVPLSTEPDSYVIYLVNRFSGERIGEDYRELLVMPAEIKVRRRGVSVPSKRRLKEVSAIAASYQRADYLEFYPKEFFSVPLSEIFITSNFAVNHGGVDLRASAGTKVSAISSGRVIMTAKKLSLEGNMVIIDHGSGVFSYYMHLSRISVNEGQLVDKGQLVGLAGATGDARGAHLHFAVKVSGVNVDPLAFIDTINSLTLFGENR
jgi:murein DD-endopeptidase MepM/ murein hydrolase activator NlpD